MALEVVALQQVTWSASCTSLLQALVVPYCWSNQLIVLPQAYRVCSRLHYQCCDSSMAWCVLLAHLTPFRWPWYIKSCRTYDQNRSGFKQFH